MRIGFVLPVPALDTGPYAGVVLVRACGHAEHVWLTQIGDAPAFRWVMPEGTR